MKKAEIFLVTFSDSCKHKNFVKNSGKNLIPDNALFDLSIRHEYAGGPFFIFGSLVEN